MGTMCGTLLAFIFLLLQSGIYTASAFDGKETSSQLNFRYIDDVFSIHNPDFEYYLGHIYPVELEMKDTAELSTSVPTLDQEDDQFYPSLYD